MVDIKLNTRHTTYRFTVDLVVLEVTQDLIQFRLDLCAGRSFPIQTHPVLVQMTGHSLGSLLMVHLCTSQSWGYKLGRKFAAYC